MNNRPYLIILSTVILAGCGSGEHYAPVQGIVVMDGEPLAGVNVIFEPITTGKEMPPGKFSVGQTNDKGEFSLRSMIARRDGAAVGAHRVRIVTPDSRKFSPQQVEAARKKMIAQEKKDGVPNPQISDERVIDFLNESTPGSFVDPIPVRYNQQTELRFEVKDEKSNKATFSIQSK